MSLWNDYEADAAFEHDYPFGVLGEYWHGRDGEYRVSEMTEQHIRNCMRIVGEDDPWFSCFQEELERRKGR